MSFMQHLSSLVGKSVLFSLGCSGLMLSASAQDAATDSTSTLDLSGEYVGYYSEDVMTNPEDPTTGTFNIHFAADSNTFEGKMNFTFYGCQNSNIGKVSGEKPNNGETIEGTWSGSVDGRSQSGPFVGEYNADKDMYEGTFGVDKGKQFIKVEDCIEYYIAPKGTWKAYSLEGDANLDAKLALEMTEENQFTVSNNSGKNALAYAVTSICVWPGQDGRMQLESLKQTIQMGQKASVAIADALVDQCRAKSDVAEMIVSIMMRDNTYQVHYAHKRMYLK